MHSLNILFVKNCHNELKFKTISFVLFYIELTLFIVLGKEVIVDDERLATALSKLPELRREVLLLYYFVGYRDEAIGRQYGRCRSTINHRRNVALKQLRKEWEKLKHEEQKADTF